MDQPLLLLWSPDTHRVSLWPLGGVRKVMKSGEMVRRPRCPGRRGLRRDEQGGERTSVAAVSSTDSWAGREQRVKRKARTGGERLLEGMESPL